MLRSYQRSLLRVVVSALMVLVFAVTTIPAKPRTPKAAKIPPRISAATTTSFSNFGAIEISAVNAGSIAGGWSLNITTDIPATTTTLQSTSISCSVFNRPANSGSS